MSRKSYRKKKQRTTAPAIPPAEPAAPPRPVKRPGTFDADTCGLVCAGVRAGLPNKHAAEKAGIGERTLYQWLTRGKADADAGLDTPHTQFVQDIKNAAAEFVAECTAHIKAAAPDQWQAAAWLMERKHPAEFAAERVRLKQLETHVADLTARLAAAEADRGRVGTADGDRRAGGSDRPPGTAPAAAPP